MTVDTDRFEDKPTVYIAGGFYGDFNTIIKEELEGYANFLDPRDWNTDEQGNRIHLPEEVYFNKDIEAIKSSDIMIAVKDSNNPGLGTLFEIGYAAAMGLPVILVASFADEREERYWGMARQAADFFTYILEDGIDVLEQEIESWMCSDDLIYTRADIRSMLHDTGC